MTVAVDALHALAFANGHTAEELVKSYLLDGRPLDQTSEASLLMDQRFEMLGEVPLPADWDRGGEREGKSADDVDYGAFLPEDAAPANSLDPFLEEE